jgi:hypothetical protein
MTRAALHCPVGGLDFPGQGALCDHRITEPRRHATCASDVSCRRCLRAPDVAERFEPTVLTAQGSR